MQEYKQGDEYEACGFDEEEDVTEEGEEETAGHITSIYGIPIKFVIIGGVIILVLILIAIGINFTSSGDRYADEDVSEPPLYVEDSLPLPQEPEPLPADPVVEEPEAAQTLDNLGSGDQALLRKYGYNADEINLALEWGFSVNDLVEAAMEVQDEAAKEALKRMSDTAGPEFKELLNSTYLGQPEITVDDQRGLPAEELVSEVKVQTINADYVKCPTRGTQLLLKCRIGDNTYFWYAVTPQRWVTLPESGNIVLDLSIAYYGDDIFVIDAREANDALSTINSADYEEDTGSAD